ncbi:MAG TPA: universal stress protein [Flavobacteriaceae bacterium]|nr:universal stress protein [Flavobacteriaceae bacterium]
MKRILVPTDFSDQAENALKVAAQLAKKYGSEIYLLHMLELPLQLIDPSRSGSQNLPESMFFMKLAHQRFDEVMKRPYLEGVKVHETVEFHEAFEGIMEISQQHRCDLIIMGSNGATGLKEVFIGSNTEKVVRHSEIPVLVIKNENANFHVYEFIFATDFTSKMREPFSEAVNLARKLDAKIHLVYINTANKFKTSMYLENIMSEFVEGLEFQNYTLNVHNDDSIEKGIVNFAERKNANLIGISTHGRKGLAHLLNGSLSEDLVNHVNMPVITFKIPETS